MTRPRTFRCEDCGAEVTRVRRHGEPLVCLSCGVGRAEVNAAELAARSGPSHDRWKAAMAARFGGSDA